LQRVVHSSKIVAQLFPNVIDVLAAFEMHVEPVETPQGAGSSRSGAGGESSKYTRLTIWIIALNLLRLEKGLGGKPMPQCLPLGATVLLPKTVGDFTNPLRVIPFVLREPTTLDLREVLRIMFRHKSQDGLVTVDGHDHRMNDCPFRILSRCYFDAEGHLLSYAFRT
jgi:hypothetical protein